MGAGGLVITPVCLCLILTFCFSPNHPAKPALVSLYCRTCTETNKACLLRAAHIGLCDPLNCAEDGGLWNNCWSSQLRPAWRPQRAESLRLNVSLLERQEVGSSSQCASVKGAPAFVVGIHHHIWRSVTITMTVQCVTCCIVPGKVGK